MPPSFLAQIEQVRSTSPSLVSDALSVFDADVHRYFTESTAIDTSQSTWQQAQLIKSE